MMSKFTSKNYPINYALRCFVAGDGEEEQVMDNYPDLIEDVYKECLSSQQLQQFKELLDRYEPFFKGSPQQNGLEEEEVTGQIIDFLEPLIEEKELYNSSFEEWEEALIDSSEID